MKSLAFIDTGGALQQEAHDELLKCDIVETVNSGLEWHCQCDLGAGCFSRCSCLCTDCYDCMFHLNVHKQVANSKRYQESYNYPPPTYLSLINIIMPKQSFTYQTHVDSHIFFEGAFLVILHYIWQCNFFLFENSSEAILSMAIYARRLGPLRTA